MKLKKVKIIALLLFGAGLIKVTAQESVPATGGNFTTGEGSISYTVGQIVYTTNYSLTGSAAQGVQQPYEISIIKGFEETYAINLLISVYPNPITYFITLKIENWNNEKLFYQLYNLSGKLLENNKVTDSETIISMKKLLPATYLLKVTDNNKTVKTFKIIKN